MHRVGLRIGDLILVELIQSVGFFHQNHIQLSLYLHKHGFARGDVCGALGQQMDAVTASVWTSANKKYFHVFFCYVLKIDFCQVNGIYRYNFNTIVCRRRLGRTPRQGLWWRDELLELLSCWGPSPFYLWPMAGKLTRTPAFVDTSTFVGPRSLPSFPHFPQSNPKTWTSWRISTRRHKGNSKFTSFIFWKKKDLNLDFLGFILRDK